MLVISQGIDRRDAGILREIDDVLLGKGPDDHAVHHAPEDAGGVLDRLAPAELDVVAGKEHREASQLADTDLEGNPGAGGGLRENHRPGLACERLGGMLAALRLQLHSLVHKPRNLGGAEFLDG